VKQIIHWNQADFTGKILVSNNLKLNSLDLMITGAQQVYLIRET